MYIYIYIHTYIYIYIYIYNTHMVINYCFILVASSMCSWLACPGDHPSLLGRKQTKGP